MLPNNCSFACSIEVVAERVPRKENNVRNTRADNRAIDAGNNGYLTNKYVSQNEEANRVAKLTITNTVNYKGDGKIENYFRQRL